MLSGTYDKLNIEIDLERPTLQFLNRRWRAAENEVHLSIHLRGACNTHQTIREYLP